MQMKINVRYYSSLQASSPGWGWGKKFTLSSLTPTLKAHMKDRGTYPWESTPSKIQAYFVMIKLIQYYLFESTWSFIFDIHSAAIL